MKATALLEQQHREIDELFRTLEGGPGNADLVERLATALTAHAMMEEEIFYPAAKRFNKNLVLESLEEHDLMAHALKRVARCAPERESFQARLKAAKEVVKLHVQEEETQLLPAMAEALGDEDETLGDRMESRFNELSALGYEGALAERKARRSHDGQRGTEKAAARSSKRNTRSQKAPAKKKASHAQPRGA